MNSAISVSALCSILVVEMGSPSFRQRERAAVALDRLMPLSVPYLEPAEAVGDPEIELRAYELISKHYESTAEQKAANTLPPNYSRLPWLDQLPMEYPNRREVISHYLAEAHKRIGRKGPNGWEDYRLATQLYLRQLYSRRHTSYQVGPLLERMRDQEIEWIARNGKRYSPPIVAPR